MRYKKILQAYGQWLPDAKGCPRIVFCNNLFLQDIPTSIFNVLIRYEFKYGYIAVGFSVCRNCLVINLFWYRLIIGWRR